MADETPRPNTEAPEGPAQTTEPITPRKPVRPVLWGLWALVILIVTLAVIQFSGGGSATNTPVRRQESGPAPKTADEQQVAEFQKQQQAEAERLRREQQQAQEALSDAKRSYQDFQNSERQGQAAPSLPDAGPQPAEANGAVTPAQAQAQERERRRRAALNASMIAIDFSGGVADQKAQTAENVALLPGQGSRPSTENEEGAEQATRGGTGNPALAATQSGTEGIEGTVRPASAQTAIGGRRKVNYDLNSARGPEYVLFEGTVLESVLTNRLDGEYAAPVNIMLTTDMWNHDRSRLLIPKGTRLLGEARQVSSQNQRRLAVAFHRMIMPDGFSYNLDQFIGLDQQGATGLSDKVNHHYVKMFGAAIAVGGIGGLAQIGAGYNGFAYDPGVAIRTGISQQMGQEAMQILDRFLNVLPQITIREGTRVRVWLTQDIAMPAYANHTINPALETRAKAEDSHVSKPAAN